MHPPGAGGAPVQFTWAAPNHQMLLSAFFLNDSSPPELLLMTLITVLSPDLVVKANVGDHGLSALQLNIFVAAVVFSALIRTQGP